MKSNVKSSLTSACILCVILLCLVEESSPTPLPPESTSAAPSIDITQTASVDEETSTEALTEIVSTEITTELPITTEPSMDATQGVFSTTLKPSERPTGLPQTSPKTTLKASGSLNLQPGKDSPTTHTTQSPTTKQSKSPTAPDTREIDYTDLKTTSTKAPQVNATFLSTTPTSQTQAPVVDITEKITTTTATTKPKITTPRDKPTEPATTPHSKTATPDKTMLTMTEGHQPGKTEGNRPEGTSEGHKEHDDHQMPATIKPGLDESKNVTGWFNNITHNTMVSKLMLPVILGIVAAFFIVCFAYAIRACKKTNRSGQRKMMQNGTDHEMGGNLDRMKLLADSSEDEF